MENQARKDSIRRRLLIAKYPRRTNAAFSNENDHNPLVLKDCPNCSGRGAIDICSKQAEVEMYILETCAECSGAGIIAEVEHYFSNETPAIEARISADGWIKCPCCGWKFALKDSRVWTGHRHKRCGQKLNIV